MIKTITPPLRNNFLSESYRIAASYLPLTKKIRPLTHWRFAYTEMMKKIFGYDIYIFIHLPALYINAFVHPESQRTEQTFLKLILSRQTYQCNHFEESNSFLKK